VEGVIGVVKSVLGFRQFLLRGLEHVKTEWCWLCTAFLGVSGQLNDHR
jgi:hypothetical protein